MIIKRWNLSLMLTAAMLFAGGCAEDQGQGADDGTAGGVDAGDAGSTGGSGGNGSSGTTSVVGSGPRFNGGGTTAGYPLTPGLGPDTAGDCPDAPNSGSSTDTKVADADTQCFYGDQDPDSPAATVEYVVESDDQSEWVHLRVTFDPGFVDNTYGANSIGWGNRMGGPPNAHHFRELVASDHVELKLLDGNGELAMHFKVDYLEPNQGGSCGGYATAGVTGGDGTMFEGDAAHVLATATSLDRNLNACGYCMEGGEDYTQDSPATDASYTPNDATPKWDYRMTYDVWVDAAAFGDAGFGQSLIEYVHASPAKTSNDTVQVQPDDCPPDWDEPYCPPHLVSEGENCGETDTGDECPEGYVHYLTSEGASCEPAGDGGLCPEGSLEVYLASEGATCVPDDGGDTPCPEGYQYYLTSEGETCEPTPDNEVCPDGYEYYLASEGERCSPVPDDGSCASGYVLDAEGHCVPDMDEPDIQDLE